MTEEPPTRGDIARRKLGPGYYVREDEWVLFVEVNEPLYLSYMISNAPFKDLLPQYMPVQQLGHYPPRLSFGFAIHNECSAFRQVALEKKLGRRKVIMKMRSFHQLQALVLDHLNKECDLPPEDGIRVNWICSKDACLVLELETNYEEVMPTEKIIKAIKVIKRVFGFPRDARPKWYLEDDIDLRDPDEFLYEPYMFEWSDCPQTPEWL